MHYLGQLPDLPLPHTGGPRLRTRRQPLAQIILCQGCCCGQTARGLPAVPLDWLKPLWKAEKLNKAVQLTVSGCLGPCDLPNVCCINTPEGQAWYGRLTTQEDYAVLLAWARRCREGNALVPLPRELEHLRFTPWQSTEDGEPFTPVAQDPADIVLLTAADTEVLTWCEADRMQPVGFPSVRALNLDKLRDRRAFDVYLDDVLQEARVLVVRVLGGLGYWREQLEAIHLLARAHDLALCVLPGDAGLDPDLAALCTVPLPVADRVLRYCTEGGVENAGHMLRFLSDTFLDTAFGHEPPRPLPKVGVYHPDHAGLLDLAAWRARCRREGRPTVGLAFYRAHWVTGNLAPVEALVRALEARGLNVLPVFGPHLAAVLGALPSPGELDVLLTTTSFSAGAGDALERLDVPVLQAIFCASSENVWAANVTGLSPRDVAMNVALPEFDGRLITAAVSFKNTLAHDVALQTDVVRYQPRADRVAHVADLARNWARLRRTPPAERKVAILLANYPSKNARVGNAVGLDTPASLHALLRALRDAGYDTGPSLPADGQALIEAVIASSIQDPEFATARAHTASPGWVPAERYRAWSEEVPSAARAGIAQRWGGPERAPQFHGGGFPVPGLLLGKVFVGVQPARGYDQDPAAVYHCPDLPPPPFYLAFYRWVRDGFGAYAVVHLGKHGNLEWLPGKSVALSDGCYPEVMLRDLPNVYPYIINNPGEGTQAKRRAAAVIVDHLIPPMTQAGTYGALRRLEHLLDEYYAVQSLDPAKAPLLLEEIGRLVEEQQLHRDFDCAPSGANELPDFLRRLDGYLCEIKEAQIRDGLHILGQLPEGDQLVELLLSLVRVDNGEVPGLVKALAEDLGCDYRTLTDDPSAAAPVVPESVCAALRPGGMLSRPGESAGNCPGAAGAAKAWHPESAPPSPSDLGPARTAGDVLERLNGMAMRLVAECCRADSGEAAAAWAEVECGRPLERTRGTLRFLWGTVWPRLQQCRQETDQILAALDGRFVRPGPSGAPTRGTADILPTGRNFYSLDIRAIPSRTAWRVGRAAADALLRRHVERTGGYPESVALVVWGTSNMRTHGDDIAEILYLLGMRPRWDDANRRVLGVEPISLIELGRPRIDVTVRVSGLFRDAFPNLVRLLNDAVAQAARLEEPLDRNFVRAHIARDTALMSRPEGGGLSADEAARRAGLRVFGSKPGAYGAGLLPLIDGRNWRTAADLAEVYLTWGSYAYTGLAEGDGREERDAFRLRLTRTQVVAQNQDNREHDLFDSDDYFQFHGGLVAAVRALAGAAPEAYLGDTSRPDAVRARTLREEACRVFRSRVVNPRWLEGVMRHGYKGAVEMAATVDYLFGYDATAEVLDDWMYEQLAAAYLLDERVRDFVRRANPWAERAMLERLLEAAERGLWEQPDAATLARLRALYGDNDAWLEGRPQ
jgi:cobaltochelatase CobN